MRIHQRASPWARAQWRLYDFCRGRDRPRVHGAYKACSAQSRLVNECNQEPGTGLKDDAYALYGTYLIVAARLCGSPALPRVAPKAGTSSPLGPSRGHWHAHGCSSRSVFPVMGQLREQEIAEDFESLWPRSARQRYPVDSAEWERPIGQQSLQSAGGERVAQNEFR